jgi:large subunit ribosomal protein L30
MGGKLRIKLVKSPIGYSRRQKETVRSLGLRRLQQVVEWPDTPTVRGMVAAVQHLVQVEQVNGHEAART